MIMDTVTVHLDGKVESTLSIILTEARNPPVDLPTVDLAGTLKKIGRRGENQGIKGEILVLQNQMPIGSTSDPQALNLEWYISLALGGYDCAQPCHLSS